MMYYWNKSTIPGEETPILKYYQNLWEGWKRVWEESWFLNCSVGALSVDINYTTFYYKEEILEEILKSRDKCYCCKYIVYGILLHRRKIFRAAINHWPIIGWCTVGKNQQHQEEKNQS